ncbi:MAG: hypothetical protein J6W35_03040 [Eubacterium sp.]|nr:hypothetical protein [Eubacterium sp.]
MKNTYKFGDIPVEIEYRGNYFEEKAKDYITNEEPLFSVFATDEDLEYEQEHSEEDIEYSKPYLEYIAIYRLFCERAIDYGVVLFHSSVVEVDGKCFLFAAKSGTGKSTHTRMWREVFGDRAVMINDDKPLIRKIDDKFYAYGTPWDGKHELSVNRKSPIKAICYIERGEKNEIEKGDAVATVYKLLAQVYRPRNEEGTIKVLDFADSMLKSIPMYEMKCTISHEAAQMAYDAMKND